ncbi:MAG: GAF domain-containing protein, partial [Chloroflexota bacterium]
MPTGSVTARGQTSADACRRLEALANSSCLISLGLDAEAILTHTAQTIARLLDSPYLRIWQLEKSTGDLILVAVAGDLSPTGDLGRRCSVVLNTLNLQVLARGQLYQTANIQLESGWVNSDVSERLNLPTYVGVPLIVGDRTYGLISMRFKDARIIRPEDLELAQAIAAQAAVALHNAAVFAETRRHEDRLTILAEITSLMSGTLEPDAVLIAAAQAARKLLNARLTSVWIYNESTQLLDLRAHDPADEAFQVRTLRMDDSLGGWVLQLGKPFVSGDIGHHPLWKHALASDAVVRGGVVVPFYDREQPLGILIALGEDARAFDQQDIELLDTLAGQVGVAVQNARHFAAARDQARRLSTLMRVNRHLTLGRRIEEILETIAEDAANLIGGEAAGIRLVEQGNLVHVASFGAD